MIKFYLNDRRIQVQNVSTNTTLLQFLREDVRQTGTKEGCAEGDCGACTVAVQSWDADGNASYRSMNSCLIPLPSLHNRRVYTVEGLTKDGRTHPVQDAMVDALGSQCGYCTPGFVMSLFAGCYRGDVSQEWQKEDQICGNLCRCTGYRPIRDALEKTIGTKPQDHFLQALSQPQQDRSLQYETPSDRFFIPSSLGALWAAWEQEPNAICFSGATDLGLEITKKKIHFPALISLECIPEMTKLADMDAYWYLGAAVPLSDIELFAQQNIPSLARMLRYFGARQIKNRATLGGNICTASPIGDTPPVLLSLDASFELRSAQGMRVLSAQDFFIGYRQTALRPKEILSAVRIPKTPKEAITASFKVSKRRELDISAVSLAVYLEKDTHIRALRLAYGGMAAIPMRARHTENALLGAEWSEESILSALDFLSQDFSPLSDHRASRWYRMEVARNLLLGFFHEAQTHPTHVLQPRHASTLIIR